MVFVLLFCFFTDETETVFVHLYVFLLKVIMQSVYCVLFACLIKKKKQVGGVNIKGGTVRSQKDVMK